MIILWTLLLKTECWFTHSTEKISSSHCLRRLPEGPGLPTLPDMSPLSLMLRRVQSRARRSLQPKGGRSLRCLPEKRSSIRTDRRISSDPLRRKQSASLQTALLSLSRWTPTIPSLQCVSHRQRMQRKRIRTPRLQTRYTAGRRIPKLPATPAQQIWFRCCPMTMGCAGRPLRAL